MKNISNILHASILQLLESFPERLTGDSIQDRELKRKAVLLRKKLERCKNMNNESTANKPREEQR